MTYEQYFVHSFCSELITTQENFYMASLQTVFTYVPCGGKNENWFENTPSET